MADPNKKMSAKEKSKAQVIKQKEENQKNKQSKGKKQGSRLGSLPTKKPGYSMKMGSKQKHDPSNFSQKDQSKMAKIPGSDNPENFRKEGLGLVGLLGGNIASFGKQVIRAVRYKPWIVKGKKYGDIDRLTGKVTNKFNK